MNTKEIKIGTTKVNAVWTAEMVDDIKRMSSFSDTESEMNKLIREMEMLEKMTKRGNKIDEILEDK